MMYKKNINIIYLGWFLGDWSFRSNSLASASYGLSIRTDNPENTGDISNVSSLDEDWVFMNQMIKYLKFGFGKTTEFINEEIIAVKTEIETLAKNTDQVTQIKLTEVKNLIKPLCKKSSVHDDNVINLLNYYNLVNELKAIQQ